MAKAKGSPERRLSKCCVDGCASPATRVSARMCEKHYYRVRRRGSVTLAREDDPPAMEVEHSNGYVLEYAPHHPLSTPGQLSRVYQHRLRLYEERGEGPFSCHWCGVQVTWGDMHVDHLNDVRSDNRPENLVPSCALCNQKRGKWKSDQASRARAKHVYEMDGETLTAREWAARLGIAKNTLVNRVRAGWPLSRALTEPRGPSGPKGNRAAL